MLKGRKGRRASLEQRKGRRNSLDKRRSSSSKINNQDVDDTPALGHDRQKSLRDEKLAAQDEHLELIQTLKRAAMRADWSSGAIASQRRQWDSLLGKPWEEEYYGLRTWPKDCPCPLNSNPNPVTESLSPGP